MSFSVRVLLGLVLLLGSLLPAAGPASAVDPHAEQLLPYPTMPVVQVTVGDWGLGRLTFKTPIPDLARYDVKVFNNGVPATVVAADPSGYWVTLRFDAPASLGRVPTRRFAVTIQMTPPKGSKGSRYAIALKVDAVNPAGDKAPSITSTMTPTVTRTPAPTLTPLPTITPDLEVRGLTLHSDQVTIAGTTYLTVNAKRPNAIPAKLVAPLDKKGTVRFAWSQGGPTMFVSDPVASTLDMAGPWQLFTFVHATSVSGLGRMRAWLYRVGVDGKVTPIVVTNLAGTQNVRLDSRPYVWFVTLPKNTLLKPGERWAVAYEINVTQVNPGQIAMLEFDTGANPSR